MDPLSACRWLWPGAVLAGLASCATILSRSESHPEWDSTVYGGTRFDALVIAAGVATPFLEDDQEEDVALVLLPFALVDLPLSLVADTLILPWTVSDHFSSLREDFHAFVEAMEEGDLARAQAIAASEPGVLRGRNGEGRTPLELAVAGGQLELLEWLAQETAPDDATPRGHETPLIQALDAGRADMVRILLDSGSDPNRGGPTGSALHRAAAQPDPALARMLLDRGAVVDAGIESGDTPLRIAAVRDHAPVAELLLARGAAVDARTPRGETPLHAAAHAGHLAVARVLVAHGADVNARKGDWDPGRVGRLLGGVSAKGTTPLGEALSRGHREMVEFLRSLGAVE